MAQSGPRAWADVLTAPSSLFYECSECECLGSPNTPSDLHASRVKMNLVAVHLPLAAYNDVLD